MNKALCRQVTMVVDGRRHDLLLTEAEASNQTFLTNLEHTIRKAHSIFGLKAKN